MRGVSFNELHSYVKGAALEADSDEEGDGKQHDKFEELLGKVEKPGAALAINKSSSEATPSAVSDGALAAGSSDLTSTRAPSLRLP